MMLDNQETRPGKQSLPSDRLYRALIDYSLDGIAVQDADGLLAFVSPSHERILGLRPEQMLGQSAMSFIHPDDQVKMRLILGHIGESAGNVIHAQWRQRHGNGSWRWLEGVGINLCHVPEIGGIVTHFRDVTERRLQDEALRLSEVRLRQIIDLIPAYIYAKDFHGRYILANDMTARALGRNPAELEGRTRDELLPHAGCDSLQIDREVILSGELKMIPEERFDAAAGQVLRTYKIPYVSPDTGHPAALSVSMDITELKQAEAALLRSEANLRAIIENTDLSYMLIDRCGRIVSFNRLASDWIQRELHAVPAEGLELLELVPTARRAETGALIARVLGGETLDYEKPYPQPDGSVVWYEVKWHPVGSEHESLGVCFSVADISGRKQAEQRRREHEAHLEASQKIAHIGSWELDLTRLDDINVNPLRWSDECFRVFGLEPGSVEVSNELFFSLVHPEDRPAIEAAVSQALASSGVYDIAHRIIRPDGSERILHERAEIIHDMHTGQRLKMIGTAHDITELREKMIEG